MGLSLGSYTFSYWVLATRVENLLSAIAPGPMARRKAAHTVHRLRWLAEELVLNAPIKVMDVGANPMDFDAPYKPLLDAGICEVIGFEPQKAAFDKLEAQKGEKESYINAAVGDGEEHAFYLYESDPLSSFFVLDPKVKMIIQFLANPMGLAYNVVSDRPMPTVKLDNLDEIDQIDFLKIDIQGGELMVMENAREKLAQAVAVQTEMRFFRIYEDEPCFGDVDRELTAQGFEIHSLFDGPTRHPIPNSQSKKLTNRGSKQLLDNDFIYIRGLRMLEGNNPEQLKKLALLAEGVFESPELALLCIDLLVASGDAPKGLAGTYRNKLHPKYKF